MTATNRTNLKALFETGDTIFQSSFEDLIDSFLNLVETSTQTIAGPISFDGGVTFTTAVNALSSITMGGTINVLNSLANITGDITNAGTYYSNSFTSAAASIPNGTTRTSATSITKSLTFLTGVSAGTNDAIKVGAGTSQYWTRQDIINLTSATAQVFSFSNSGGSNIDGTTVVQLFPNQRMSIWSITISAVTTQYTMVGTKANV